MVSFFAKDRTLTVGELEEIKAMITREIQKQKRKENG
jgi:hypothetical protein